MTTRVGVILTALAQARTPIRAARRSSGATRAPPPSSLILRGVPRAKGPAHHRAGRLPAGDLPEPGAVVHGLRAEEHDVWVAPFVPVHWIRFHEPGTPRPGVVHGRAEHPLRQAPP